MQAVFVLARPTLQYVRIALTGLTILAGSLVSSARATVMISASPTQNMSCSNGICAPTATDAVLNISDLQSYLASNGITVTTYGSGVQANDIEVSAAFTWNTSNLLALESYRSIKVDAPIVDAGSGALKLQSNKGRSGGDIGYNGGNITFLDLSSRLKINGSKYTLVPDIKSLAAAIAANPNGKFALASDYDASADGTYSEDPVETTFGGIFDGLGNVIANLSMNNGYDYYEVGFFNTIASSGVVKNFALGNASIAYSTYEAGILAGISYGHIIQCGVSGSVIGTPGTSVWIGGLVGANEGLIEHSYSTATVSAEIAGGLVGGDNGTIRSSFATGAVSGTRMAGGLVAQEDGAILYSYASGAVTGASISGGLVGLNFSWIAQSFANGPVSAGGSTQIGGLVGLNQATVEDSYATGSVVAGSSAAVGGFVGCFGACGSTSGSLSIATSYSTGQVGKSPGGQVGGFAGADQSAGGISNSDWDITTSGRSRGTGNRGNEPGLTGHNTEQLQSRLPSGFSKKVWALNPNVNGGFPYLIANPPPQ